MFGGLDRDRLGPALHLPLTLKQDGESEEVEKMQEGVETIGGGD